MDSRGAQSKMENDEAGLCAACVHVRLVRSGRGSAFYLCRRSESDPRFARYPRLPVVQCAGFERNAELSTK